MKREKKEFCVECRQYSEYEFKKVVRKYHIRDKEYDMEVTIAVCKTCGEEINVPGIMDLRAAEVDRQYREFEKIIKINDIKKLMELYHIGKAPLSLALGFGEITITRYLQGQVPSKEYSYVMKNALGSPKYMMELLNKNVEKIGDVAYRKSINAAKELESLMGVSDKMLSTISYIFEKIQEITPLALQKMLYYCQGIYMAIYQKPLFEEDCIAWVHGPVYESVYSMFKTFKYNPIDDVRFVVFKECFQKLNENERMVIDMVTDTFGMYSGKVLEKITHTEEPWKEARKGYFPMELSNVVIDKKTIQNYFENLLQEFDITTREGINKYIYKQILRAMQ